MEATDRFDNKLVGSGGLPSFSLSAFSFSESEPAGAAGGLPHLRPDGCLDGSGFSSPDPLCESLLDVLADFIHAGGGNFPTFRADPVDEATEAWLLGW